ncbi:winged helix-turn-helix domain-containing protein [Halorientalis brevis]|uniref:Winged helix-turn-helix domain-containing protein n=1 Tax=Halorientalis brevis TaxID=1126241 RepID=A0ABD6CFU6_9EURY|nr:winged helix-turn-helix domain-containing protein [Halorientalis brevis]
MPISADHFENIDTEGDEPTPGTNAHEILSFLEQHPDQAFTQSEIADETDVTRGSVGPTLVRLRESGRVDHRGKYWRISDHARSLDHAADHADAVAASYEEESFDYDEWQAHAVDPREDRE